jgi:hypothetical protein
MHAMLLVHCVVESVDTYARGHDRHVRSSSDMHWGLLTVQSQYMQCHQERYSCIVVVLEVVLGL